MSSGEHRLRRIGSGFDFLAPWYDFFAALFLGGGIMRAQRHFVPRLGKHDRVLIFGGGTGRILTDMIALGVGQSYVYIDISQKMLAAARRRVAAHGSQVPVEFLCGSTEMLGRQKFSLIVTPFVLDCFSEAELAAAMQKLSASLRAGGAWHFSDFHVPRGLMGFVSGKVVRLLYFVFNAICGLGRKALPDFDRAFSTWGFSAESEAFFLSGMLVSRIYRKKARRPPRK